MTPMNDAKGQKNIEPTNEDMNRLINKEANVAGHGYGNRGMVRDSVDTVNTDGTRVVHKNVGIVKTSTDTTYTTTATTHGYNRYGSDVTSINKLMIQVISIRLRMMQQMIRRINKM